MPDLNKPAFKIYKQVAKRISSGHCATCNAIIHPNTEFRDALSVREYEISGMCQECQDSVFGEDGD